jgi:hypothetical protein
MSTDPGSPRVIPFARRIPLLALLVAAFLSACGPKNTFIPKTGPVRVRAHDDLPREGQYCRYQIVKDLPEGATMKIGDVICIFCPASKRGCDDYSQVEENDGRVYAVKALTKGRPCTTCPKGTDTPPGWAKERQPEPLVLRREQSTRLEPAEG